MSNGEREDVSMRADEARVRWIFDTVKKCVVVYGVIGAIIVETLGVVSWSGGDVSTFMWVRAAILLAITPVFSWLTVRASRGMRKSFERLRLVSIILPVAIVVVDLIPGLCPAWYAGMQAVSALALAAVAVLLRRRVLNGAFAERV